MAYCLWAMGYSTPEMLRTFKVDPSYEIAGKWKVRRKDIHTYFTDEFWHNLSIYQTFKTMGLPYNMGWAQHPKDIVHLIRIFNAADIIFQNPKAS